MARRPNVLIVDDRPDDEARTYERRLRERRISASAQYPAQVEEDDVADADLILVDYDLEAWTGVGVNFGGRRLEIARRPKDGMALASVLRRYSHDRAARTSPTSVALITQKIGSVARPLPATNRAHIVAALNGLEWVFDKKDKDLLQKIESLANATLSLPKDWTNDVSRLAKLLKIPSMDKKLAEEMLRDALRCVPPVHEIREWEQGIALIRWLLHRVLPYPSFLIDINNLAARFHADPSQLMKVLSPGSRLERVLLPFRYDGVLSDFAGDRWWRVGIEAFLWEETDQQSFETKEILSALNKYSAKNKLTAGKENGVVVLDEDFVYERALVAKSEAVRIWPDDWPSFALQPWTSLGAARVSKKLAAWVLPEDRDRL